MSQNKIGNSKCLNESQDSKQTLKNTNSAKDLLKAGEYNFSASSDHTLKNTIDAMNLLRR